MRRPTRHPASGRRGRTPSPVPHAALSWWFAPFRRRGTPRPSPTLVRAFLGAVCNVGRGTPSGNVSVEQMIIKPRGEGEPNGAERVSPDSCASPIFNRRQCQNVERRTPAAKSEQLDSSHGLTSRDVPDTRCGSTLPAQARFPRQRTHSLTIHAKETGSARRGETVGEVSTEPPPSRPRRFSRRCGSGRGCDR